MTKLSSIYPHVDQLYYKLLLFIHGVGAVIIGVGIGRTGDRIPPQSALLGLLLLGIGLSLPLSLFSQVGKVIVSKVTLVVR